MRFTSLSLIAALALCACGGGKSDGSPDGGPAPGEPDAGPRPGEPDAGPRPGDADAAVAPVFRNPVATPDAELAVQALALLGADVAGSRDGSCNDCHGITRERVRQWDRLSDLAMATCLTDLTPTTKTEALATLDCLRASPAAEFKPEHFGVVTAAAHLPWFEYVFQLAYEGQAAVQRTEFLRTVSMPKEGRPLFTQAEFDIVAEWFARGAPATDATLPQDPPPTQCLASVSSSVRAHVTAMSTQGWAAVNADNGILMHGCGNAASPKECLRSYPLATSLPFGASWTTAPGASLRVLRDNAYMSSYWTRSSPDGRFVAHGNKDGRNSTIIDLAPAGGGSRLIDVLAEFDPGFFPDNSGFVFQRNGSPGETASACTMSALISSPTQITFRESGCGPLGDVGLYQHLGGTLGGDDYWAIQGQFENDDSGVEVGGARPADPVANFSSSATLSLTEIIFNGRTFEPRDQVSRIAVRYQGDSVVSPSAKMVVTRVSGSRGAQLGYAMYKLDVTGTGDNRRAQLSEVARYCAKGGKPAFSLDERWMVVHHYLVDADAVELGFTGASDPAFARYRSKGAANVYLIDLATGQRTRITRVAPGQYALYPHFRSDGWLYFMVRDPAAGHEYVVASDAALVLGAR